jgi:hypothetical protein
MLRALLNAIQTYLLTVGKSMCGSEPEDDLGQVTAFRERLLIRLSRSRIFSRKLPLYFVGDDIFGAR